jgi:class 3 adenylate cyclase/predicted ATPase
MQAADEKTFLFEGYTLDLRRGCLRRAEGEVELRPKSFAVLRYLVENAGRLVSKDELIATIWTNVIVTDVSLARCVSDVRLALQDQERRIIRTVSGRGYLFAATVSQAANGSRTADRAPDESKPELRPGECRQLTVMGCELVGLAALSARLDPEDLRDATAACHQRCSEIIERHHGYVARYAGDCLLAYFGYPEAREQDAENSVHAALTLQVLAGHLSAELGTLLQPCIGIATGIVMVGDKPAVGERTALGEALTLSSRLQSLAKPGQIIVAPSTRRLVGGLFDYHDLGRVVLKGLAAPVEIAQVLGQSNVESRFEAYHPANLTPLVGRDEEIQLLLRRWRQAKDGEGTIVLLAGEPGIGKSRIAQAVLELLSGENHTRLRLFCSPHHQYSALYPFIRQLERAAGFRRTDTDEQRLTKLETALAEASVDLGDAVPLLAELFSIPTSDRYPQSTLTPQKRKETTLEALAARVEGLAASRPLLLVIEDVHWADPTSLELIDMIVERAPHLRLLVIITFRPEFVSPWAGRIQTTPISLGRLAPGQCREIIAGMIHGKRLPKAITDEIIQRTDGVPLFVEELTKAVIESGALVDAGDHYTVSGPLPAPEIPMTLRASLLARLDRYAPAREVAQIGAALGRRFSHQLIGAVAAMPQQRLGDALAQLVGAELLWRRGNPPDAEYTFKHALVQDAAYGTLLREPRRALHARIAETLASQFADIADTQPELLAHHCAEAGLIEKAATLWGKAGQLSLTRSALKEAAAQFARSLGLSETLPSTAILRREQITLQIALANALMHTKGYAAPETRAALDRARSLVERADALGEPPEDPLLLLSVLHGFWVASHVAFDGDAVRGLSLEFMALAEKQGTIFPLVLGHRLMGTSLLFLGDIAESRTHLDRALSLYDPALHRPLATRFGHDVGVAVVSNRPLALWLLGYPEAAQKDADDALNNARDIGQTATYLYALTRISWIHLVIGNYAAAATQTQQLMAIAEDIEGSYWKAAGMMLQGCLFALTGKGTRAIEMITSGIRASRLTGWNLLRMPWYLSCLARAHVAVGQLDQAKRCIGEAMTAMAATKESWQESELHQIAGDLELMSPGPDAAKAEAHYDRALTVARRQKAKSWELRAAMALARLWRDQGKQHQAKNVLALVHSWFTEGFDTFDLKQAGALLAELEVPSLIEARS